MNVAIVTGATGQDGSFLIELLLDKGYTVIGLIRRSSSTNTNRISHLIGNPKFIIEEFDMADAMANNRILSKYGALGAQRIEVYNLAAQSHVATSFEQPYFTFQTNAVAVYGWLEAIRQSPYTDKIRYYQAGTSEMFGKVQETPQRETTAFYPRSPYGVAKLAAYWACRNYRESYGMFICNGILFNHESERRGENFVTRKITLGVGSGKCVELGNIDASRDWGHARDYVLGMWMMLQADTPDDYILATGQSHTIREFVNQVFIEMGVVHEWIGNSVFVCGREVVKVNPDLVRPCEVDILTGDYTKAREKLGWEPKISFEELVRIMVRSDIKCAGASSDPRLPLV
jgi:GDPmannose 4,6-dehydratase